MCKIGQSNLLLTQGTGRDIVVNSLWLPSGFLNIHRSTATLLECRVQSLGMGCLSGNVTQRRKWIFLAREARGLGLFGGCIVLSEEFFVRLLLRFFYDFDLRPELPPQLLA